MCQRDGSRLRVCLAGTFDPDFHRNRHLARLLKLAGLEVVVVHAPLWGFREDRVVRRGKLLLALRAMRSLPLIVYGFLRVAKPDVLLVAYPGHFDMPWLAAAAKWRSVPVVFDPFISLFDTVVEDRALVSARSPIGRLLRFIDRRACRRADMLLSDTPAHAQFLAELSGVAPERFRVLWVGADETLFHPQPVAPEPGRILFYGTFIPLHGIEIILGAAKLLAGLPVHFHVIGTGQERARMEALVRDEGLTNVDISDAVPLEELPGEIARSWLCLGIFGSSAKASRVIPNKVFQCLAVGRPVLTGGTPAIHSAFAGHEIATVPAGDAAALAAAVRALADDPSRTEALAAAGHRRFENEYRGDVLAARLAVYLREAVYRQKARRALG